MHVLYTENKHGKVPNLSTIAIIIDDVLLEHVGLPHTPCSLPHYPLSFLPDFFANLKSVVIHKTSTKSNQLVGIWLGLDFGD